jgi:cysteine desulfurase
VTAPIYLDHSATTPVDPRVLAAMLPFWTEHYGNPSSGHSHGRRANLALQQARRTIADLLHAQPSEIIFTGCGSESNNLALRGVMWNAQAHGRNHLITSAIEHEAVLATAEQLHHHFGCELTVLGVDEYGRVSPADVQAALRPTTALVSIMAANNEIGTLQPILEIGEIVRQHGALFHTDAVQSASFTAWDMATMPIDLLTLAPHKFYGPKGVGILYARKGVGLMASQTGGSQEDGRRAGTSNVPLAVGAAVALELATAERESTTHHCRTLRDQLISGLLAALPPEECVLTGHPTERLPHHASFALRGLTGNDILMHLDLLGICASSGSACSTGNPEPSPILQALGLGDEWTRGGLRLTVGQQNTAEHITTLLENLPAALQKLRAFATQYS